MCSQFLPQEKVVEFAKITPQVLLKETQRAVAPADVLERHEKLIKLKKEMITLREVRFAFLYEGVHT
jgi:hypothetical protein